MKALGSRNSRRRAGDVIQDFAEKGSESQGEHVDGRASHDLIGAQSNHKKPINARKRHAGAEPEGGAEPRGMGRHSSHGRSKRSDQHQSFERDVNYSRPLAAQAAQRCKQQGRGNTECRGEQLEYHDQPRRFLMRNGPRNRASGLSLASSGGEGCGEEAFSRAGSVRLMEKNVGCARWKFFDPNDNSDVIHVKTVSSPVLILPEQSEAQRSACDFRANPSTTTVL